MLDLVRANRTRGKSVAMVAGGGAGAWIGSGLGIAAGPLGGIAGTIPGAIIGGALGYLTAAAFAKCPGCGKVFKK